MCPSDARGMIASVMVPIAPGRARARSQGQAPRQEIEADQDDAEPQPRVADVQDQDESLGGGSPPAPAERPGRAVDKPCEQEQAAGEARPGAWRASYG